MPVPPSVTFLNRLILALLPVHLICKALTQYVGFKNHSGDSTIFLQMFFHTLQGDPLYNTFEGGSHLGVHFSPVLLLLTPVMAVIQAYPGLMLCNTLALTAALFLLVRHLERDVPGVALLVLILLSVHPTLIHDSYRDFHALSLVSLPFAGLYVAWREEKYRAFCGWLAALLLIRENLFVVAAGWALICWRTGRPRHWGLTALGLAALHFVVANLLAPTVFEGGIRPSLANYYLAYGTNLAEVGATLSNDPLLPLRLLAEKGPYLFRLCLPFFLFLPFLRPWWLLALPTLAAILFSSDGRLARPELHFSVEIVWWFALSSLAFLRDKASARPARAQSAVKVLGLLYVLYLAGSIFGNGWTIRDQVRAPRYQAFREIRRQIPPDAALVAPRYLANYLGWRGEIYFLQETEQLDHWPKADLLLVEDLDRARVPKDWRRIGQEGPFSLYAPSAEDRNNSKEGRKLGKQEDRIGD